MRALRLSETRRESETRNTSFALKPGTGLAFATLTWWRHGMPPQRSRPVALPDGPAVPNGRAATSTGRDAHKRQQDTRRAQPVRPRSRFGVVNKVHPLVADSRATSRSRANGSAKWPRRLSSMRPSVTRFTGPMRGTTATALDPLRRMSVQRISLSSSGSLTGAWYKDDDVQAQPTGKWCARHPAQPAGQSARRAADTSRAINKPQLHCCMRSARCGAGTSFTPPQPDASFGITPCASSSSRPSSLCLYGSHSSTRKSPRVGLQSSSTRMWLWTCCV